MSYVGPAELPVFVDFANAALTPRASYLSLMQHPNSVCGADEGGQTDEPRGRDRKF